MKLLGGFIVTIIVEITKMIFSEVYKQRNRLIHNLHERDCGSEWTDEEKLSKYETSERKSDQEKKFRSDSLVSVIQYSGISLD